MNSRCLKAHSQICIYTSQNHPPTPFICKHTHFQYTLFGLYVYLATLVDGISHCRQIVIIIMCDTCERKILQKQQFLKRNTAYALHEPKNLRVILTEMPMTTIHIFSFALPLSFFLWVCAHSLNKIFLLYRHDAFVRITSDHCKTKLGVRVRQ